MQELCKLVAKELPNVNANIDESALCARADVQKVVMDAMNKVAKAKSLYSFEQVRLEFYACVR